MPWICTRVTLRWYWRPRRTRWRRFFLGNRVVYRLMVAATGSTKYGRTRVLEGTFAFSFKAKELIRGCRSVAMDWPAAPYIGCWVAAVPWIGLLDTTNNIVKIPCCIMADCRCVQWFLVPILSARTLGRTMIRTLTSCRIRQDGNLISSE